MRDNKNANQKKIKSQYWNILKLNYQKRYEIVFEIKYTIYKMYFNNNACQKCLAKYIRNRMQEFAQEIQK